MEKQQIQHIEKLDANNNNADDIFYALPEVAMASNVFQPVHRRPTHHVALAQLFIGGMSLLSLGCMWELLDIVVASCFGIYATSLPISDRKIKALRVYWYLNIAGIILTSIDILLVLIMHYSIFRSAYVVLFGIMYYGVLLFLLYIGQYRAKLYIKELGDHPPPREVVQVIVLQQEKALP